MTSSHPAGPYMLYAADLLFEKGTSINSMYSQAERMLDETCQILDGLGVTIKGNTLFRILGILAFPRLSQAKCGVFADYKLFDVRGTCNNDGSWLQNLDNLRILTVHSGVHTNVFANLSAMLPDTLICPVDPLTDLDDQEFLKQGRGKRKDATSMFFNRVKQVTSNGLICGAPDISGIPKDLQATHKIVSPGSRPIWYSDPKDTNTANAMTPTDAINAGADQIVIGGPARKDGKINKSSVLRILDEIAAVKGI